MQACEQLWVTETTGFGHHFSPQVAIQASHGISCPPLTSMIWPFT